MSIGEASSLLQQIWTGERGEFVRVTCADGDYLAEIQIPTRLVSRGAGMRLEISYRPRDPLGLPNGPLVRVHAAPLRLLPLAGTKAFMARAWLPRGMSFAALRQYYLRLVPEPPQIDADEHPTAD